MTNSQGPVWLEIEEEKNEEGHLATGAVFRQSLLLVLLPESTGLLPIRQKLSGRLDEGATKCDSAPDRRGGHGKMNWKRGFMVLLGVVVLGGCATVPTGPSVTVLPGPGKPFEVFQSDDALCRQWAEQQIGVSPNEAANKNLAGGAAIGTLAGAALGAAIGAASGHPGTGAAVGAASGLIAGTAAASGPAYATRWELQRRYDIAYQQCMYSKGNQIPGFGGPSRGAFPPPPPPPGFTPGPAVSPPPGAYPAPPPDSR